MSMHKLNNLYRTAVPLLAMLCMAPVSAELDLNAAAAVTPLSQEIVNIHVLMFWISVVIAALVFIVMFWSILQQRKYQATSVARFHPKAKAEIVWTLIPIFILIALSIPATKTLFKAELSGVSDQMVKVNGYRGQWQSAHFDEVFGAVSVPTRDANEIQGGNATAASTSTRPDLRNVERLILPEYQQIRALTRPIAHHLDRALYGKTGTPMQPFGSRLDGIEGSAGVAKKPAIAFDTVSL